MEQFCLEHETLLCEKCVQDEHAASPCESLDILDASKHVHSKLEDGVHELRSLKETCQSVIDGNRVTDTIHIIEKAENILEHFYREMKGKLQRAKSLLRPFTELSNEEHWKLKTVISKKVPHVGPFTTEDLNTDKASGLIVDLQDVRKQTQNAKDVLYSLPNYVDVSINPDFIDCLHFDGMPILFRRHGELVKQEDMDDRVSLVSLPQESVHLREASQFTLEHCTDVAIFDDYLIAAVGDSIQRRDRKRMLFRQAIALEGAGKVCRLGETSEISVYQKDGHIAILNTFPDLTVLYKLMGEHQYLDISYMNTITSKRQNCPDQSPVFAVCYKRAGERQAYDYVDIIHAKTTRHPGRLPHYNVHSRTIADSEYGKQKARFRGVRNVCAFEDRSVIVSASMGITCVSRVGVLIWTVDAAKPITSIMAYRTLVFFSQEGENKITTIGKHGHVVDENILPPMNGLAPSTMVASSDTLMVKHNDQYKWTVFRKQYEFVH